MTSKMKAVLVRRPGGLDQLYIGDAPVPEPRKNEVLIQVKATSVNRMDLLQRMGRYPVPSYASRILGVDVAGVVVEKGSACSRFHEGDRVMGLLSGGGYAQYAVSHEDLLMPIPDTLSFEEAAGIPEVFLAAFQVLFYLGKVKRSDSVLVHAGAGGIGTAAIQLIRQVGAEAIVTAGSEKKIRFCIELGAVHGFDYHQGDFADKILALYRGVSVIIDMVGAPYWKQNLACLAPEGRLIIMGLLGGAQVPDINLAEILNRWIHVIGTTLRARSEAYRIELTKEFSEFALDRFTDGRLKSIIHKVYPYQEVRKAHRLMEANSNIGKIILNGFG